MTKYEMNLETKLIELEMKLTFQEDTIEQLNLVIIDQQKSLDRLNQKLLRLDSKIDNSIKDHNGATNQHEIPPHY